MSDDTPTPPDPPATSNPHDAVRPDVDEPDTAALARRIADIETALKQGLVTRSLQLVGDDGRLRVELTAADTYAALRLHGFDGDTPAGDIELFLVDAMDGEPAYGGCIFRGPTVSVWPR